MFFALLKKEILTHIYDYRYAIYSGLTIITIIGSFFLMQAVYTTKVGQYNSLVKSLPVDRGDVFRGLGVFANVGIAKPIRPAKLQILYQGIEQEYAKFTKFSVDNHLPFLSKERMGFQAEDFFPAMDFTLIVLFILSLLVFVFSFNSVSREKESGTLKLMVSYPVSRLQIILAKLAGGYIGVVLPLVFTFGLVMAIVMLTPDFIFTGPEVATAAAVYGAAALYLLVMYLVGITVSIKCRRSATAISVLVLVWLLFIVVLHNVSLLVIQKIHDPLTVGAATTRQREAVEQCKAELTETSVKKYGTRHWKIPPFRPPEKDKITAAGMNELFGTYLGRVNSSIVGHLESYINQLARAEQLLVKCSYFSPTLLFTQIVSNFTDTGVQGRLRLYTYFKDYQNHLYQFIQKDLEGLTRENEYYSTGWTRVIPIDQLPDFRYQSPPLSQRVQESLGYLAALVVLCLGLLLAAFYSFLRMEAA